MNREERPRGARTVPTDKSALEHSASIPKPVDRGADSKTTPAQDQIGLQLRSMYDDILNEATPERFLKLLEDLDQKTKSK
ncbi:NepR family anti-sigma factor [Chelatococcus asaccharovorans]|uniref:Anti-sigma factor NepR domain-containing protein n=1 Tax=Chelatococcus asaccharovorans TaxID=28210 RepID=A0A2V3TZV2_9HYPH|nr:NepR family anti-sigma factor [Chelatococcus asaccharovorans]MBS7704630.1 hypothetical protein [Chelatococcus asaccharovorans]PXW54531.1 hypothetical protein C7450_11162 [Chelatococcus asaccharovorans]CAH1648856.1 NepR domain-containing protein [Chelatococcus asaccharovorans]CAH1687332.1 NepR domain-containing protein [Chelatococcus asaccharovorans]